MNWFIGHLVKEARERRFSPDDKVRYFTRGLKGKGKGVVITPSFAKGTVVDFDRDTRRYRVRNSDEEVIDVHPRNLIPDAVMRVPVSNDLTTSGPAAAGAVIQDTPAGNEQEFA